MKSISTIEQKKRECWENFKFARRPLNTDKKVFDYIFDRAYALGKQEKEAEGEEMLYAKAKTVREMYAANDRLIAEFIGSEIAKDAAIINNMLRRLYGSKCLPDEVGNEDNFTTKEPKPAKPKFKEGDKARHHDTIVKIVKHDKNEGLFKVERREIIAINGRPKAFCASYWVKESDLEPHTGPEEKTSEKRAENEQERVENKQSRNLSQSMSNCDKCPKSVQKTPPDFGHSRLNIAAMMAQAILTRVDDAPQIIADVAFRHADALITESEKGGGK